jgi:restriction endonuclease S subunit
MRFNLWEDCNRVPLTELLSFVVDNRGKTVPTAPSGHKLIATNCVTNNALFPVYEKIRYLSEETYQTWFRAHPIPGDILFVNKGTPGRVCLVPDPVDFCIAQDMIALRADESKIYPKYLFAVLRSREIQQQIYNTNVGDVIPHFKKQFLDQLLIPIPERSIQESIGDLYYVLSLKAERNKKINDNLEQQAQAIYHERFETVSPNDLPSDWRIVTLGEVATISNKSFNPLKEPEILLEHYSIPAFDEARFPVFELSTSIKSNKFIIDASCFMISKLNPTTKRVWKPYCLTGNAVCSTEFIVYKAKDKTITDFLYSVIDSNSFSDFMCSHVTGSTGSRQRATPSDTLSYELILPSGDELAEFLSLVSPMYAQIRINAIENDRLKRLRDSLLPKLMSGEIDVFTIQL